MDIKRLLLALGLSFVFIVTWNVFFPPPQKMTTQTNPENSVISNTDNQIDNKFVVESDINQEIVDMALNEQDIKTIQTPLLDIALVNGATSIHHLRVIEGDTNNDYKHKGVWDTQNNLYNHTDPVELIQNATCNPCLVVDEKKVLFTNIDIQKQKNAYYLAAEAVLSKGKITKETIIYNDSYNMDHIFNFFGDWENVALVWDGGLLPSEKLINDEMTYFSVYAQNKDSYQEEYCNSIDKKKQFEFDENVGWAGMKSKYFIKAVTNDNYNELHSERVVFTAYPTNIIDGVQIVNSDMKYYYNYRDFPKNSIGANQLKISSYIGPIDTHYLEKEQNKHLVQLFGFGWFFIGYLGQAIMWLLTTLYGIIPNYGIVCILFAFIIRFFTGPLTKKSFLSNQKMQAIQPKLKKIQEKYKNDTAKLNQEIMGLYKNEGVNPLGGCLPILVQMPLLIALFQVFRKTIEFRGAPFLPFWITDLSQPDVIVQFQFLKDIWGLNYFFGHGIALLPIIMGLVMFLNMRMTTSSTMNPSQTSTMYIMNGFFILLFNTFPSGLNLYYTIYNVLNFLQQRKLQQLNT